MSTTCLWEIEGWIHRVVVVISLRGFESQSYTNVSCGEINIHSCKLLEFNYVSHWDRHYIQKNKNQKLN